MDDLNWYHAENYKEIEVLSDEEIFDEVYIRYGFNIGFLMLSDSHLEYWTKQIYSGSPILSKQRPCFSGIQESEKLDDEALIKMGSFTRVPMVQPISFAELEDIYVAARASYEAQYGNDVYNKAFTSVDSLLTSSSFEGRTLVSVQLNGTNNSLLLNQFENHLRSIRVKTGVKEGNDIWKQRACGRFRKFRFGQSFFEKIRKQKLIQLTDCFNWYRLNNLPPEKTKIIEKVFSGEDVEQANIYQTHFPNMELLRCRETIIMLESLLGR